MQRKPEKNMCGVWRRCRKRTYVPKLICEISCQ